MVGELSTSKGYPANAIPLIVILVITAIKDIIEDYKRRKADVLENNIMYKVNKP